MALPAFVERLSLSVRVYLVDRAFGRRTLTAADLPAGNPCTIQHLQRAGITTPAALFRRVSLDGWDLSVLSNTINISTPSLPPVTPVDITEVVAFLAGKDEALLRRSPGNVSRMFVPVLMIALIFIGVAWKSTRPRTAPRSQVRVAAVSGLPPYHLIEASDVEVSVTPLDSLAATDVKDVVGRYSARPVKHLDIVHAADLLDGRPFADLNGRTVVTLHVAGVDQGLAVSLPAVVSLLLSEPGGQARERFANVYLLAISREPPAPPPPAVVPLTLATVALPQPELDKLHPLLQARVVTVAWPPPR